MGTGTAASSGTEALRRAAAHLSAEVDAASLAVFRVLFGALILWEVARYALHDRIYRYYIEPRFFFSYLPFIKPWGGAGMYWHFAGLAVLSTLFALGLFYRVSAALLCAGLTYVFLLDKAQYLNHLYLVCLVSLLLALVPAHRALSLDHLRARRSSAAEGEPRETVPRACLFILKAQIALVYFYGGIAKLNVDWLQGRPLSSWLADRADLPVVGPWLLHPAAGHFFSYAGLLIDLSMGFLLCSRRAFPLGAALALMFHLTNAVLFRIGIFPWFMIATLVLFPDPSWPRRRLPWLFRRAGGARSEAPAPLGPRALALLHGYLLVQLLVPLRHWLYPGDVNWNEQGHRFSWRMKLRDKEVSELSFHVIDPRTSLRERVDLEAWLTVRQIDEMSTRPDMLADFARFLAARWGAAAGVRPLVSVRSIASLNGGPYRDLVDPQADLGAP